MSTINYKPLGDKVIIEPDSAEQITKTGIVLPDTAKERPQHATVVAVGPGRTTDDGKVISLTVKVGDNVLYPSYGPAELKIDDKEYLVLQESEILAIKN
ncbi:MAG: co-chaperone GroES [bacterium]|nr:co-chaperone GroES [bacterium]